MKRVYFLITILLLASCGKFKVTKEQFESEIIKIDNHCFYSATLSVKTKNSEKGKEISSVSSTEKYEFYVGEGEWYFINENSKSKASEYIKPYFEPLSKDNLINSSSIYYGLISQELYLDYITYYLSPYEVQMHYSQIDSSNPNISTKVDFVLKFNTYGYLIKQTSIGKEYDNASLISCYETTILISYK